MRSITNITITPETLKLVAEIDELKMCIEYGFMGVQGHVALLLILSSGHVAFLCPPLPPPSDPRPTRSLGTPTLYI
jgi:hypothetical protein